MRGALVSACKKGKSVTPNHGLVTKTNKTNVILLKSVNLSNFSRKF